jgi:hypothetical protein
LPSSNPVLDGEDGGFRCPIKSIKLIYRTKYFKMFESVLMTFSCLKIVKRCQNRNFNQPKKCVLNFKNETCKDIYSMYNELLKRTSYFYTIYLTKNVCKLERKECFLKDKNNLPIKEKIGLTHHHLTMCVFALRKKVLRDEKYLLKEECVPTP